MRYSVCLFFSEILIYTSILKSKHPNISENKSQTLLKGGYRPYFSPEPWVSIITVVYNSKELLAATIESIAAQDNEDYEYLVIDGGSKDGTFELLSQYEQHINYWQSQADHGLYDAMNKGLQMARGKYIWYINSGDKIENSNTISSLQKTSSDADIIYGETNYIDLHGNILGTRSELSTRKLPIKLDWKSFLKGMVVCHQSILVKKSIASHYQLHYRCSADIDWVITALKNSQHIVNSKLILSQYLIGGFSAINQRLAWQERFMIFQKHYGIIATLWAHLRILLRGIYYKLVGKKNI